MLWRDILVHNMRPLCISIIVSCENVPPEISTAPERGTGIDSSPKAGRSEDPEVWSDDEREDAERLQLVCQPYPLPLSVFIRPFRGFNAQPGGAFPPPTIFIACQHVRSESALLVGVDVNYWKPPGFHCISCQGCRSIVPNLVSCFAGAALGTDDIVCILCYSLEQDASIEAPG